MAKPEVLLFDLGGVLVEATGLQALPRLLTAPLDAETLRRKWLQCPAVGRYESGQCTESEFADHFIQEWDLELTRDQFLEEFASWVNEPYAGTGELLAQLDGRYVLACLSNSNATHWRKVLQMRDLAAVLERRFVSFELGMMKPMPEVYVQVARKLGRPPDRIAFFDDTLENIDGAAEAGLSAHQTVGPAALRDTLQRLGLL